ncbi:glycoside hydrolase [Draconibacterium mangrovi]|uniref:cellulose-binding protein n=1 Tax=Draconibacterium mangrovi TaxID=2697469 RepID=UPI0013D09EE2|nr:cellulose-binding protein [Draconibacterium mangrovi]
MRIKLLQINIFAISLIVFILLSCGKEEEEIAKNRYVSVIDNSIVNLSEDGGVTKIRVTSSNTLWKIKVGEPISGVNYIRSASPDYGGSTTKENESTEVRIYYNANSNYDLNKQPVIIQSLDGEISDTVIFTQKAKEKRVVSLRIDPSETFQTITGFGGANAIWGNDYLNESEMDLALDIEGNSLGFSIFRIRLPSNKNEWPGLVNTIKYANSKNVIVLATPWSPPAQWKSNNSIVGGGYLLKEHYGDFITYINEFIQYMKKNNAVIDVVSLQNEPDLEVSYEGCEYTSEEMLDLVKNYAGEITGAKVLAAECFNFKQNYTDQILNDPIAVNNLNIIGGHIYGCVIANYPLAEDKDKEVWMTEHLLNLDSGNTPLNWTSTTKKSIIWNESMEMVDEIQQGLKCNWNAYIWWYIRRYYSFLGDGERGTDRGTVLKRGYAISHFSKYIRPGFVRIETNLINSSSKFQATAFKGATQYVLVLSNSEDYAISNVNINFPSNSGTIISYTSTVDDNRRFEELTKEEDSIVIDVESKSVKTIIIEK